MWGLLDLSLGGYLIALLIVTQITIASVTLFLHRNQSHRALELHPIVSHFMRFWLWITTGMVTAEWVAIHRKHHANTDKPGDPHSPQLEGIRKVLWQGAELYRKSAKDRDMVAKYSHGTPNDWVEKNLYAKFPKLGITALFFINLLLFGIPGISIWALQMLWIPFHAAGVINGIGHFFGYRNFECHDAATNIFPIGFWIGGEELHNNHHAFASSAKFSSHWWEFDIGWLYIKILSFFGLAKVKKLPPQLSIDSAKKIIDLETVKAVVANRLQVLCFYYKLVVKPSISLEISNFSNFQVSKFKLRKIFRSQDTLLSSKNKTLRENILQNNAHLKLVIQFRDSLQKVWQKTAKNQMELVESLQQWCHQAEQTGHESLTQFAQMLKSFVPKNALQ